MVMPERVISCRDRHVSFAPAISPSSPFSYLFFDFPFRSEFSKVFIGLLLYFPVICRGTFMDMRIIF